jgi:hypothetical protein
MSNRDPYSDWRARVRAVPSSAPVESRIWHTARTLRLESYRGAVYAKAFANGSAERAGPCLARADQA